MEINTLLWMQTILLWKEPDLTIPSGATVRMYRFYQRHLIIELSSMGRPLGRRRPFCLE